MTPRVKRSLALLWHGLVIGLVATVAWHFIDLSEVAATLATATWPWIGAILLLATLDRFLMADKWRHLLHRVRVQASFSDVLSAYYQAGFVQRCIPTSLSGDAMRALVISQRHGNATGVLASMVVERLVAMFSAVFIAICGVLMVLGDTGDEPFHLLLMAIPVLLLAMMVGLRLSLYRPLVNAVLNWLPDNRLRKALVNIYVHYSSFRDAPRLLAANFAYSFFEQVVQILLLLACAIALEVEASPFIIIAAVSIAQCLRKFALLLEGWVLGEFTAVLVYTALGIPGAQALAFSLLGQVAHMIASLPGAVLVARSTVNLRDLRGTLQRKSRNASQPAPSQPAP